MLRREFRSDATAIVAAWALRSPRRRMQSAYNSDRL